MAALDPNRPEQALIAAWLDDNQATAYADLTPADQATRDAARTAIGADPVAAVSDLLRTLLDLDEVHELLSWIEDPQVWGR